MVEALENRRGKRGDAVLWREAPSLRVVRAVARKAWDTLEAALIFLSPDGEVVSPLGSKRGSLVVDRNPGHGARDAFRGERVPEQGFWVGRLADGSGCLAVSLFPGGVARGVAMLVGITGRGGSWRRALKDLLTKVPSVEMERWGWAGEVREWGEEELVRGQELLALVAREIVFFKDELDARERRWDGGEVPGRERFADIVGESPAMLKLFRTLDKVVSSDSTVLIYGENGTGKEIIAEAIHRNSRRRDRTLVVQNGSAFNENLLDSELFGHLKGAFTGAVSDKRGLFEVADGGTFFLDEVGEMSPALQVKLLRVLQEGTFLPVGGNEPKRVDVRIVAATNRDLEKMVEAGEFRQDLYYRLNVIGVRVPPLRERREDIPALAKHFLRAHSGGMYVGSKRFSTAAMARLKDYEWPGNVRELENEVERLVVLAGDEVVIEESLLSPRIKDHTWQTWERPETRTGSMPAAVEELERAMITGALRRNRWNKSQAARELEISRRNLIRKVQRYGLDRRRSGGRDRE